MREATGEERRRRRTAGIIICGEYDPAWTGPRSWVVITRGGLSRSYVPTPSSMRRLRALPLRFVAFKGDLPGRSSGKRTRWAARCTYAPDS